MNWDERRRTLFFVITVAIIAVLVLTPTEFSYYRRLLRLPNDAFLRGGVLISLLSKTLTAISIAWLLAWLVARGKTARITSVLGIVAVALVLGFLGLDLEVQRFTGNHAAAYLAFMAEPDAFRWAGVDIEVGGLLQAGLAMPALALGIGLAMAFGLGQAMTMTSERARRSAARTAVWTWCGLLVAGPIAQFSISSLHPDPSTSARFIRVSEAQPWRSAIDLVSAYETHSKSDRLRETFARRLTTISPPDSPPRWQASRKPNVILVVLESLRKDAFTPEVMPHLTRLAERGLQANTHYAGSNGSHYGFFSLLFGRSPINYYPTLEAGLRPLLPTMLRNGGYTNLYVSAAKLSWMKMDEFLGERDFHVTKLEVLGRPNWKLDRLAIDEAKKQLALADRPVFLVVFALSTHYDYSYPDEPENRIFNPASRPALDSHQPDQREEILNGYRNAAHHLDEQLGPWLQELDLDENLIIVTGDHGESIWDDGTIMHSSRLSEAQTRVPMAIVGPGVPVGRSLNRPTTHEDLIPTLVDLLGIPKDATAGVFGESMLREATRPSYVPLVEVRASEYGHDAIAFLTPSQRFTFALDRRREWIRFDGILDVDGRVSPHPPSSDQEGAFLVLLEDYFERVTSR